MLERSPLCCCEVEGLEGGGTGGKNSQEAVVMRSGQKGFQAVAVELEKRVLGEREGPSQRAASAGRQLLQGMSCQPVGLLLAHTSQPLRKPPPPSWDFCSTHVAPLSQVGSPPQLHLFILPEGLCRGDRSSLSCCLSIRSPCPALRRHLSSPSIWAEAL